MDCGEGVGLCGTLVLESGFGTGNYNHPEVKLSPPEPATICFVVTTKQSNYKVDACGALPVPTINHARLAGDSRPGGAKLSALLALPGVH